MQPSWGGPSLPHARPRPLSSSPPLSSLSSPLKCPRGHVPPLPFLPSPHPLSVPEVMSSVTSTNTFRSFLSRVRVISQESYRRRMFGCCSVFKMATSSLNRACSVLLYRFSYRWVCMEVYIIIHGRSYIRHPGPPFPWVAHSTLDECTEQSQHTSAGHSVPSSAESAEIPMQSGAIKIHYLPQLLNSTKMVLISDTCIIVFHQYPKVHP